MPGSVPRCVKDGDNLDKCRLGVFDHPVDHDEGKIGDDDFPCPGSAPALLE
jgi:hypothetical protein